MELRGTRTPDLLGAIQVAYHLNLADFEVFRRVRSSLAAPAFIAFCGIPQEFWHAAASAWPKLGADPKRQRRPARRSGNGG